MLTKRKADRIPDKFVEGASVGSLNVENWLKNRDAWNAHPVVSVMERDYVVDETTRHLYVGAVAKVAAPHKWLDCKIRLERVHDGWLRADFPENAMFKVGDVANNKHYILVNMLYLVTKVDDVIPESWWNT